MLLAVIRRFERYADDPNWARFRGVMVQNVDLVHQNCVIFWFSPTLTGCPGQHRSVHGVFWPWAISSVTQLLAGKNWVDYSDAIAPTYSIESGHFRKMTVSLATCHPAILQPSRFATWHLIPLGQFYTVPKFGWNRLKHAQVTTVQSWPVRSRPFLAIFSKMVGSGKRLYLEIFFSQN